MNLTFRVPTFSLAVACEGLQSFSSVTSCLCHDFRADRQEHFLIDTDSVLHAASEAACEASFKYRWFPPNIQG